MKNTIRLKKFNPNDLIFNEDETVIILKFIFKNKHMLINRLRINNDTRSFAQALLLEAIDASYSLGYVEALFRSTSNPTVGVREILKKFGKDASKHWFNSHNIKNLKDIKIYERVREKLELNFTSILVLLANGIALREINTMKLIAYADGNNSKVIWG
ncbi:hypothetical protein [Endozoicomonas numazuensis]|uniref:Uncharacterized protein n=1 Tax=Endozoicomonas numazuensis TaxID=1137799 RepID=A0A081NJT9_9GAMM|nr:hypothetical protein [Endozoicomonas numazuensis]KEQ18712.1 hypothetical protein GZ78_00945 [Endozoicomonas numazuensis]